MAFFKEPDCYDRVDWDLLQNGSVTLFWRLEYLEETTDWLKQHGYKISEFDCASWKDEKAMHEDIASCLNFPSYYGQNLDAMNDCLSEIEIPAQGAMHLL